MLTFFTSVFRLPNAFLPAQVLSESPVLSDQEPSFSKNIQYQSDYSRKSGTPEIASYTPNLKLQPLGTTLYNPRPSPSEATDSDDETIKDTWDFRGKWEIPETAPNTPKSGIQELGVLETTALSPTHDQKTQQGGNQSPSAYSGSSSPPVDRLKRHYTEDEDEVPEQRQFKRRRLNLSPGSFVSLPALPQKDVVSGYK